MPQTPEPIGPPTARRPADTFTLAAHALTAGDLEAAVDLYEALAVVEWGPDRRGSGTDAIRAILAALMALRLPVRAAVEEVLQADGVALVAGVRRVAGVNPDGRPVSIAGPAVVVARRRADGLWLAALDRWTPGGHDDRSPTPPSPRPDRDAAIAPRRISQMESAMTPRPPNVTAVVSRATARARTAVLALALATLASGIAAAVVPGAARASVRSHGTVRPALGTASRYVFLTLGDPADPTFNQLLGINDQGVIAGYYGSGSPATVHPNRGYTLAPYSRAGFSNENYPGAQQTQVTALNDYGRTVGFYVDRAGNNIGFVAKGGVYTSVIAPGAAGSPATTQLLSINNEGMAAGFYNDKAGNSHPFLYNTHDGRFTSITVPGAVSAMATGINDVGEVVGIATNAHKKTTGFIDASGAIRVLADRSASATQPFGVNDQGQVVGQVTTAGNKTHGFVFARGVFQILDDPAGVGTTTINGINSLGDLVGFYTDAKGNTDGFVAQPQVFQTPGA